MKGFFSGKFGGVRPGDEVSGEMEIPRDIYFAYQKMVNSENPVFRGVKVTKANYEIMN